MIISTLIAQAADETKSVFGTGLAPENTMTGGLADFNLNDPLGGLEIFISRLIGLITAIGGIVFVFMFLYGAIKWISAGGDSSKVEKARDTMVQGVVGLIIMVGAYGIIGLVGTIVGIDILNPADQIEQIFQARANPAATLLRDFGNLFNSFEATK